MIETRRLFLGQAVKEEALCHATLFRNDEGEGPAFGPVDRVIGQRGGNGRGGSAQHAVEERPMAQGAVEEESRHCGRSLAFSASGARPIP